MRPKALLFLAPFALAACSGNANRSHAQSSPAATPPPLRACETREMSLDGIDMVLQANIDGTLGSITLVRSADSGAQDKAIDDARKIFGDPRPDTRTTMHQSKWGIVGTTDTCGRPVTPSPTPSSPA